MVREKLKTDRNCLLWKKLLHLASRRAVAGFVLCKQMIKAEKVAIALLTLKGQFKAHWLDYLLIWELSSSCSFVLTKTKWSSANMHTITNEGGMVQVHVKPVVMSGQEK